MKIDVSIATDSRMVALGSAISTAASVPLAISLSGNLAAGKTTFARGFLRGLGHEGAVKSPTFTLVESYLDTPIPCHHFDLYRIADPEELEYLGLDEYFDGRCHCLVEWPERGADALPDFDLVLDFQVRGEERLVTLQSTTAQTHNLLEKVLISFLNSGS